MTRIFSDNFYGTPGEKFTGDSQFTSIHPSTVYATCRYGVGVKLPAGNPAGISGNFGSTSGSLWSSTDFIVSAAPGTTLQLVQFRTPAGAASHHVRMLADGKLQIYSGSAKVTTTNPVPFGSQFRVLFAINAAGTLATLSIFNTWSDTTPTQTVSASVTPTVVGTLRIAAVPTTGTGAADITVIWPELDTTGDPGLREYVYLTATAQSGIVPKLINVTVNQENISGSKQYAVDWGDGQSTGYGDSPTFSHTFTDPGVSQMVASISSSGNIYTGNPVSFVSPSVWYVSLDTSGVAHPIQVVYLDASGAITPLSPAT